MLARDGFRCRYCGAGASETKLEVDHLHPCAKGGEDCPENLVTACQPCNRGKSDRRILGISGGFALAPHERPARLARADAARENARHWIGSDILDILDRADGQSLVVLHCATHDRAEEHWIDDDLFAAVSRGGGDAGWLP